MAKTHTTPEADHAAQAAPSGDAWAYTPDHRQAVERALVDSAAGRVYRLSEEDLVHLMDQAQQARRDGREYRLPRKWLQERDAAHAAAH